MMKYLALKKWINFIYIFGTVLVVLAFIWFRFIREHLPKDIPFTLTVLNFLLLVIICFNLLNNISLNLYLNKKAHTTNFKMFFMLIRKPFELLDETVKKIPPIKALYDKNILSCVNNMIKYFYLLTGFDFSLRIIMLILFICDIMQDKIFLTYKFIWLLFIIYIISYIKFSLEALKKERIAAVEEATIILKDNNDLLLINDFISNQTLCLINKTPILNYILILKMDYIEKIAQQLNLKKGQSINGKVLIKSLRGIISFILQLNQIIVLNQQLQNKYKILNLLILCLYFGGWSYILFASLHTLHVSALELEFMKVFQDNIEPFSQSKLLHHEKMFVHTSNAFSKYYGKIK